MQITFSAYEVSIVKDVVQVLIVPALGWFMKAAITKSRTMINEMVTDNVNRIKEELIRHIDDRFERHEVLAFSKLTDLTKTIENGGGIK